MNDYDLINNLLEDGSPQAILKLKMIVNIDDIDLDLIHSNKRLILKKLYKEYFDKFSYFIKQIQKKIQKEIDSEILKQLHAASAKLNNHE